MNMNDMVIISVDDHITEPPDMFDKHLSADQLATAPKFCTDEKGKSYWTYQGMYMPSVGLNAVVGRPLEEYGMEPTSLDEMREGVYNVHARIGDMNANGVAASLNFGTCVGFDGGRFHKAPDKKLLLIHLRAYNDWHIDEWCAAYRLKNLDSLNEDMIAYECDYPHSDTLWPEVPEHLWASIKHLTDDQIDKITHRNAMRFFRFDPFTHSRREELTVGALRARAAADKVDTAPKSYGGDRPLATGEAPRRITSGDLMKMFAHHAQANAKAS